MNECTILSGECVNIWRYS